MEFYFHCSLHLHAVVRRTVLPHAVSVLYAMYHSICSELSGTAGHEYTVFSYESKVLDVLASPLVVRYHDRLLLMIRRIPPGILQN